MTNTSFNLFDGENKKAFVLPFFIFLCVLWTCFEAPLAFVLNRELKEHHLWWDLFFSGVFFIDIYLKATGRYPEQLFGSKNEYLKSRSLYLDIVISLPYDLIAASFGLHIVTKTIVALRFLRVLRIFKLRSVFSLGPFLPKSIKLGFTLCAIGVIIHFIACGWMALHPNQNLDLATYYTQSLYWAVTTLTTVGYGDITPTSNSARIYTMVVMIVGAACYGFFIANLSRMILLADRTKEERKEKLRSLNQFMLHYNIPRSLRNHTFTFYQHLLQERISKEDEMVIKDLPQALQDELYIYKKIKLLKNVHVFMGCSNTCLKLIATKLDKTFHSPSEFIVREGDDGDEMFIIGHGKFEVRSKDKVVAILQDGQFFGELALIESTQRSMDIVSKSYCELYRLHQSDFEEITRRYPELLEKFQNKYHLSKLPKLA